MLRGASAGTFATSRTELCGLDDLGGAAELARTVVRAADRIVVAVAITGTSVRRVDGWLDAEGFVIHPAASASQRVAGSLVARSDAAELLVGLCDGMLGPLPARPASHAVSFPRPAAMSPRTLPVTVRGVVVLRSSTVGPSVDAAHLVVGVAGDGLVVGTTPRLDRALRLRPVRLADVAGLVEAHITAAATSPGGTAATLERCSPGTARPRGSAGTSTCPP